MPDSHADPVSDSRLRQKALILVWGPPSHGPRSRVLARELDIGIRFMHVTERRGLLVAPYKYAGQALATIRCLVRERPRTVLVQSPPSLAVLLIYTWSLVTSVRYVIDAHSDAMDSPVWTRPKWLHRHLARRAAATVVTNQHYAQRVRSWGARALMIRDVPTTFDVGAPWPSDEHFRVAVVNSFAPDEPLEQVMAAAASLPDVRFFVTGSLRRADERLLESAPTNVTFTDYLADDRYYALLWSSDAVMCLTTRDHTMQRGACEALSLGTPIITSRWPLLEEYFHEGTVHVDNDAASIGSGIREMRRHLPTYQHGIAELRAHQLEEWRAASRSLRSILDGEASSTARARPVTLLAAGLVDSLRRLRRRRTEAVAARRALRHASAVIPVGDQGSLQVLEDPRDLELLRAEWAQLQADFPGPANSIDWCVALARTPPAGMRLCVITLRNHGRLVALAPLKRSETPDGRLRLINEYDATGLLYVDDHALARLVDIVLALRRPLVFASLLAGSPTEQVMRQRLRRGKHLRLSQSWTMGPAVAIGERPHEPLAHLSSKRRNEIRRRRRMAEELGTVTFHVDSIGCDVSDRFAEFVGIEGDGWKGRTGSPLTKDVSQRETLLQFITAPEVRDDVRIASMCIDGRPVAVDLVLVADRRLWGFKGGYDERFSRCSPGILLKIHLMAWAADEGLEWFELMGRMENWKRVWGAGRILRHVRVYPRNPRGALALGIDAASPEGVQRALRARRDAR